MSHRHLSRRRFLQWATGGTCIIAAQPRRGWTQTSTPSAPGPSVRRLFIDDRWVEERHDLERVMHRPRKEGLIQEADGRPWETGDQLSVVRDRAGRFHMTYRATWPDASVRDLHPGIGEDKAHWFRQSTAYAVSEDGIRWQKPVLGLVDGPVAFRAAPPEKWRDGVFYEPTGLSRANNLGCPLQMIQDLTEFGNLRQPARRYLINVLTYGDTHPFAEITEGGLYFAADVPDIVGHPKWRAGLEVVWEGKRRGARGPITRVAGWDAQRAEWFECGQASFGAWTKRGGRDIARWTSRDLQTWGPEALVLPLPQDESREPQRTVEYMDIRVWAVADFWLGQLIIFHGDRTSDQYEMPTKRGVWRKGTTEMRLILSRDAGETWQRVGGTAAWIPHHPADNGFDRLVFTASPVRVKDELWLYYGCWDGDHLVWNRDGTTYYKDRTRIGRTARAVLRWDGFASLHAGETRGQLLTKPVEVSGSQLRLNTAAARGRVRVELTDATGKALPGFRWRDCPAIAGDGVSLPVNWRGRTIPRDRPLRLRFEVTQADLFGFEFV